MLKWPLLAAAVTQFARFPATAYGISPEVSAVARRHLRSIMPSREQERQFITPVPDATTVCASPGWTYDADLGWRLYDAARRQSLPRPLLHWSPQSRGQLLCGFGGPRPRKEEIEFLVSRIEGELSRHANVLPAAALVEYREALRIYQEITRLAK